MDTKSSTSTSVASRFLAGLAALGARVWQTLSCDLTIPMRRKSRSTSRYSVGKAEPRTDSGSFEIPAPSFLRAEQRVLSAVSLTRVYGGFIFTLMVDGNPITHRLETVPMTGAEILESVRAVLEENND